MKPEIKKEILKFFKENPKPDDSKIHDLSDKLDIDTHEFEGNVYEILGSFIGAGMSKDFDGDYDSTQLKMGIKVEMEHTTDKDIAERIAMDHLAEIPDYYTRLAKMEKEAENKNESYKRYKPIFNEKTGMLNLKVIFNQVLNEGKLDVSNILNALAMSCQDKGMDKEVKELLKLSARI